MRVKTGRLGAALALALGIVCAGPVATASVTCDTGGGSLLVTVPDGGTVAVELRAGEVIIDDGVCGASVDAVDEVRFEGASGATEVVVRLGSEPLPPIALDLGGGDDRATILGTEAADSIAPSEVLTTMGEVALTVEGDGGDDLLDATTWGDPVVLLGGDGNDRLVGGPGADLLSGGGGSDNLVGAGGADVLEGGAGTDRADYSGSPFGVRVRLGGGAGSGGDAVGDLLTTVEGIIGSPASDILIGDAASNTLLGGFGDDVLDGRGGADVLAGGFGDDVATYAASPSGVVVTLDAVTGNAGGHAAGDMLASIEDLVGSRSGDVLTGNLGPNRLVGGAGDDVLDGTDGDDVLVGGGGDDLLVGGEGQDLATFASATLSLTIDLRARTAVGQGRDELFEIERVIGGASADTIVGDGRANVLQGGPGPDILFGLGGADTLLGGGGGDYLDGGIGTDRCDGGPGADRSTACP